MRRYIVLIFLIVWAFNSNAQTIYFNRLYGNSRRSEAGFGITLIDSNYFIAGGSNYIHSIYPSSALTILLNSKGDTIWTRQDSTNNPNCFDIESLNNSLYEIGNADFPTMQEIYFRKYRSNGDTIWTKYFRFDLYNFGQYLIPTHDYGLLIVGAINTDSSIDNYNSNNDKVCIIKTDSNGNIQWVDSLLAHSTGSLADAGVENKDNSFTITGWYGVDSALVLKLDSNGELLWYKTYQSGFNDETGDCIIGTADDGYLIAGNQAEGLIGYEIYYNWVMKIDSLGNMQWQKTYGDSLYTDGFRQIRQTLDGNYVLIGSSQDYSEDTIYANLYKIDSAGNVLFERRYYKIPYPAGNWDGLTYDVLATPDSGFIFVGSNTDTTQHVWVVKTDKYGCDSVGCQLPTGIAQIEQPNSSFNIYPNPALSQITVVYDVPLNTANAMLIVYDLTGRMVRQTYLDNTQHYATLDLNDLPAAMYLVELKTDDGIVAKKLVVE